MSTYKLVCSNRSRMHGSFVVYQVPPALNNGQLLTLAWLSRPSAPNCRVTFNWSNSLHFVWGEMGTTLGGGVFDASQCIEADPYRANMVDLDKDDFGAPMFQNLRTGGTPGTLTIRQLNNVFDYPVSIGVGVGCKPAYTVDACANITTTFIPLVDRYWVVFGNFTQGQTFDVGSVSGSLMVEFDYNAPVQNVVLDMDNMLQLVPSR